jgi:hypothetical protein
MQNPLFAGEDPRSVFNGLDMLDRAIMMNEMREDTGALMAGNALGNGIFGAMSDIYFLSYYEITAAILLGM